PIYMSLVFSRPPGSTSFPYTTLFRSDHDQWRDARRDERERRAGPAADEIAQADDPQTVRAGGETTDGERLDDLRVGRESGSHQIDRKSTRLNSSHEWIPYAVFCLK